MTNDSISQPEAPARPRRQPRRVEVRRVEQITPRVRRVTFHGQELADFAPRGPGAHIKVMLPRDGETEVMLPPPGPDGRPQWPDDAPRPPVRTYTPRSFDPETLELDVEFVVHGDGPASTWAAQAAQGQRVIVMGPGGGLIMPEEAGWFVIAADEPAIPAACTLLEALPDGTPARVILEVPDAAEERELPGAAELDVTWLHRGHGADERAGTLLETEIRALSLPDGVGHVWVACEAEAMRRIRLHLLRERGLDRERITTRGYWKLGAVDHPDHDYGEDVET
jgi:NADPH-dependent ferric siderophore reductase